MSSLQVFTSGPAYAEKAPPRLPPGVWLTVADGGIKQMRYQTPSTLRLGSTWYRPPAGHVVETFAASAQGDLAVCEKPRGSEKPCRVVIEKANGTRLSVVEPDNVRMTRLPYISASGRQIAWIDRQKREFSSSLDLARIGYKDLGGATWFKPWSDFSGLLPKGWTDSAATATFSGSSFLIPAFNTFAASETGMIVVRPDGTATFANYAGQPRLQLTGVSGTPYGSTWKPYGVNTRAVGVQMDPPYSLVSIDENGALTPLVAGGLQPLGISKVVSIGRERVMLLRTVVLSDDVDAGRTYAACFIIVNIMDGSRGAEQCNANYSSRTGVPTGSYPPGPSLLDGTSFDVVPNRRGLMDWVYLGTYSTSDAFRLVKVVRINPANGSYRTLVRQAF